MHLKGSVDVNKDLILIWEVHETLLLMKEPTRPHLIAVL